MSRSELDDFQFDGGGDLREEVFAFEDDEGFEQEEDWLGDEEGDEELSLEIEWELSNDDDLSFLEEE